MNRRPKETNLRILLSKKWIALERERDRQAERGRREVVSETWEVERERESETDR